MTEELKILISRVQEAEAKDHVIDPKSLLIHLYVILGEIEHGRMDMQIRSGGTVQPDTSMHEMD